MIRLPVRARAQLEFWSAFCIGYGTLTLLSAYLNRTTPPTKENDRADLPQ